MKTQQLLESAEAKLAEFASAASAARDYDSAGRIIAAAQAIKRLEEQFRPPSFAENVEHNGKKATVSSLRLGRDPNHSADNRRKGRRLGEYPRFFRDGNRLVKVAWSKTDKREYEHRCPKDVVSSLVSSVLSVGAKGDRFAMDRLLPITDPTDGSELPTYQAYVALAWLRSVGLLEQHGRQGYSIRKGISLASKVEDAWNQLT